MADPKPDQDPQPGEGTIPGAETAADTVGAMTTQAQQDAAFRAIIGDFEAQLAQKMAAAEAAFEAQRQQLGAQLKQMQAQVAAVRQQAGPPEPVLLAASLKERVANIATHHPDLGAAHFAGVVDQASRLNDAVKAAADGQGTPQEAIHLAQAVSTWFERSHPRISAKFLEGGAEVLNEAERIIAGIADVAPAVAAVASAL